MSTEAMTRYVLVCDGCGAKHSQADGGHRSAIEARAAAYSDGWRFPPHVRKGGKPGSTTSDACPECLPNWTPQERAARYRVT
jgi:hypothetical protein